MNIEKLPEELMEAIRSLKNGSITIQADVIEALENAEDLKDFEERVKGAMNNLMEEIKDAIREFTHRQLTEKERDRMIDIYASGPLTYIPAIDDPLFLLGLIEMYDSEEPPFAVVAKHNEDFFYAKDGSVLPEWYGKRKENKVTEIPAEMDEFREMASDIIDDVTEAIEIEYPDLKPKKEFLDETPDAAILYGASYYNLESKIEDKLREKFTLKDPDAIGVVS